MVEPDGSFRVRLTPGIYQVHAYDLATACRLHVSDKLRVTGGQTLQHRIELELGKVRLHIEKWQKPPSRVSRLQILVNHPNQPRRAFVANPFDTLAGIRVRAGTEHWLYLPPQKAKIRLLADSWRLSNRHRHHRKEDYLAETIVLPRAGELLRVELRENQ